jgi:hypothetical protein
VLNRTCVLTFILIGFITPNFLVAQTRCGTPEYIKSKSAPTGQPDFELWLSKKINQRASGVQNKRVGETYRIPVVVHIIHNGEDVGTSTNLSDEQVESQIAVLNDDYQRLNADAANTPDLFKPVAAGMDIEFVLARRTPDGLPTNGIVRVDGNRASWTSDDDVEFKSLSYWNSEDYLNIWVVNITDYLGYSQFPVSNLPGLEGSPDIAETDGVVISYTVFGSDDYGNFDLDINYNKGRTTTHEIGHFFGLRHIWGDDGGGCGGNGDYVSDTPDQGSNTIGCPSGTRTSCSVSNMYQNYLDYTDDECMNLFTIEQVNRMTTVLENSPRRASLLVSDGLNDPDPVTTENLTLKSIEGPVVTCASQVDLALKIRNSGIEINSFNVVINGSTTIPFSGLAMQPGEEASFIIPGNTIGTGTNNFSIQLTQPNGNTDTYPADNSGTYQIYQSGVTDFIPLKETFEGNYSSQWIAINPTLGMNWEETETNFEKSLYFEGYSNQVIGDRAWLVGPVLDLSDFTEASLSFDVSYVYRSGKNDNLKVLASKDCGLTFDVTLFNESGNAIPSPDDIDNPNAKWAPVGREGWRHMNIPLGEIIGFEDVRIAFVFTNANGNNLYLDNIEFFNTSTNTATDGDEYLQIFPNGFVDASSPVNPSIRLNLQERDNIAIDVSNSLGKRILSIGYTNALNQTITLPMEDADPGMYIVRVTTTKTSFTQKFILVR